MKRIVNGVTYNTDLVTIIGRSVWDDEEFSNESTLYVTRGGAYFVVFSEEKKVWSERDHEYQTRELVTVHPKSAEEVRSG